MTAAQSLADQGFPVHLVERSNTLGGNLRHLHYTLADVGFGQSMPQTNGSGYRSLQEYLVHLINQVETNSLITLHVETELTETEGFMGSFTSTLVPVEDGNGPGLEVSHGATIVATGGVEYRGDEYGYGTDPRILTQQEFETLLAGWYPSLQGDGAIGQPGGGATSEAVSSEPVSSLPNSIAMILCVGPAEQYCSRICCTTALKNVLMLKQLNPEAEVTVIYRDIRTYGFKERLYTEAREAGVLFVHYDFDGKPEIVNENGDLTVRVWEEVLGKDLELKPDLLVLSTPVVPAEGARELATTLKVSQDMEGFFLEAHVKLRPVDFSSDGIFMAGMAHYPKLLDETIVQAQAAAARAATLLAQDTIEAGGRVAVVDETLCVGCLTCVRTCPYGAPRIVANLTGVGNILGAAQVETAICHGCGSCAAACPAKAIDLMHYKDSQVLAKVDALFAPEKVFQELD
jgi:heterodisulfide reductase subunit A-like polyferredoxin